MKIKTRFLSIVMCLVMFLSFLPTLHANAESIPYSHYMLDDGTIVETYIDNSSNSIIERITASDNSTVVKLTANGNTVEYKGNINYNLLKISLYQPENLNNALPRGVDVHSTNFKHLFMSSNKATVTQAQIIGGASAIAGAIGAYLSIDIKLCIKIGRTIATIVEKNSKVYSCEIYENVYQVNFSYDNEYYTHCYHENVQYYDSGNHIISSEVSTYERVGG